MIANCYPTHFSEDQIQKQLCFEAELQKNREMKTAGGRRNILAAVTDFYVPNSIKNGSCHRPIFLTLSSGYLMNCVI